MSDDDKYKQIRNFLFELYKNNKKYRGKKFGITEKIRR